MRARIAVFDAQPLFRVGVVHTLRSFKSIELVAEGHSSACALHAAGKHPIDIMLIDLAIPGGGLETLATISRMWPAIRLIVLTASERVEDVSAALQGGARGYILKGIDSAELLEALRRVVRGEVYLAPSLGARLFLARAAATRAPVDVGASNLEVLTAREDQILSHVSLGATNKEIANKLNISEKTVKYYMTSIMQKLRVRNRVEAVVVSRARPKASASSAL